MKSIIKELETASRPIVKVIHKTDHSKGMSIGLAKGLKLSKHKTNIPTTLLVLEGTIKYTEGSNEHILSKYETYQIPVDILHEVDAIEDSVLLLIQ